MSYTPDELQELVKSVSAGVFQHFIPRAFVDYMRAKRKRLEQLRREWMESPSQQRNDSVFLIEAQIEILDDLIFELDDKHRGTQEEADLTSPQGDADDRD